MTENRKLTCFEDPNNDDNDGNVIGGRERKIGDDVPVSEPSKPVSEERIPIFHCFGEDLDAPDIPEPDKTPEREELIFRNWQPGRNRGLGR